jgi:hypothetical protein
MIRVEIPSGDALRLRSRQPSEVISADETPVTVKFVLGLQGLPAKTDVIVRVPGPLPGGEVVWDWQVATDQLFDVAHCKCRLAHAPTADQVYPLLKDGSPWVSMTFAAGSAVGVVTFDGVQSVAEDDYITFVPPSPTDETAGSISFTLAGK